MVLGALFQELEEDQINYSHVSHSINIPSIFHYSSAVSECLTGVFLHAIFYFSRILCSLSVPIPRMSRAARRSQD